MFQSLLAFGVAPSISVDSAKRTIQKLELPDLVFASDPKSKPKSPSLRWFTLLGPCDDEAERLIARLTHAFSGIVVVGEDDRGGLAFVHQHALSKTKLLSTKSISSGDHSDPKKTLDAGLTKIVGKGELARLKAEVDSFHYVGLDDDKAVKEPGGLEWVIEPADAYDVEFDKVRLADAMEGDPDEQRRRAFNAMIRLFDDPARIDEALTKARALRKKGKFLHFERETKELARLGRWKELAEAAIDGAMMDRDTDSERNRERRFNSYGWDGLATAAAILAAGHAEEARSVAKRISERWPFAEAAVRDAGQKPLLKLFAK